jgi:O-antigen/teichoic acid export membrane protein
MRLGVGAPSNLGPVTVIPRLSLARGRGLRALAGRAGWSLADQMVASATNLVLSVMAARALSVDDFGAFAVAFTVYSFLIAGGRAMVSRPLTVRYTAGGPEHFKEAARSATGATVVLGIASGVVVGVTGLFIGGTLGISLICMGLLMPGLLLQDMWRLVFIAQGRPRSAFVNDVVWGVLQLAAVSVLIVTDRQSAGTLLLGWGGAALAVAFLGILQFRGRPRVRTSMGWMRQQSDLLKYYFASFITVMGANQITLLLIAGLGTPADVGALRAAQVVLGPLNLLGYALHAFALPEISRRQPAGRKGIHAAAALSAVLFACYAVGGVALLALPDEMGEALLGDTWASAQSVLPASLLGLLAIAVIFGPNTLLIGLGFAKETFVLNSVLAPAFLIFGLGGLQLAGAQGAALGLSLAQVVLVPAMWWRVVVLMRRGNVPSAGEATDVRPAGPVGPA